MILERMKIIAIVRIVNYKRTATTVLCKLARVVVAKGLAPSAAVHELEIVIGFGRYSEQFLDVFLHLTNVINRHFGSKSNDDFNRIFIRREIAYVTTRVAETCADKFF